MPKTTDTKPAWDGVPMRSFTCIGRRRTVKGKAVAFFLEDGQPDEEAIGLDIKGSFVGQRFQIAMNKDGTWWPGSRESLPPMSPDDDPRMVEWQLQDRAAYGREQVRLADQRAKKQNMSFDHVTMHDLKDQMQRMPYNSQQALLAQVLLYLARP